MTKHPSPARPPARPLPLVAWAEAVTAAVPRDDGSTRAGDSSLRQWQAVDEATRLPGGGLNAQTPLVLQSEIVS
jgi:hypothetical protein